MNTTYPNFPTPTPATNWNPAWNQFNTQPWNQYWNPQFGFFPTFQNAWPTPYTNWTNQWQQPWNQYTPFNQWQNQFQNQWQNQLQNQWNTPTQFTPWNNWNQPTWYNYAAPWQTYPQPTWNNWFQPSFTPTPFPTQNQTTPFQTAPWSTPWNAATWNTTNTQPQTNFQTNPQGFNQTQGQGTPVTNQFPQQFNTPFNTPWGNVNALGLFGTHLFNPQTGFNPLASNWINNFPAQPSFNGFTPNFNGFPPINANQYANQYVGNPIETNESPIAPTTKRPLNRQGA